MAARQTAFGALLIGLVAVALTFIKSDFFSGILPLNGVQPSSFPTSNAEVYDPAHDLGYLGTEAGGVEHFRNIFYGMDTSGHNRFKPPVPYMPAPGSKIDATEYGAWCPQGLGEVLPFTSKVVNVSENCLSLQIARPAGTKPDAKLPVLVWIHGGGNMLGSGAEMLYRPDGLVLQSVADQQPVIWVAINYRLGVFGYANSTALYNAKHTNAGLRDQRTALEWVRDNIAAFGGDASSVTAIGQSAGGSDIGLHLLSYRGKKGVPFQKAHMMSGSPGVVFNIKSTIVADNTAKLAKDLGCTANPDSEALVDCLRDIPMETLRQASVKAAQEAYPPFGELYFFPYADEDYIPDRPSTQLRAGEVVPGIPLVISWVYNDGGWYAPPTTAGDEDITTVVRSLVSVLSDDTMKKMLSLYPVADYQYLSHAGGPTAQYHRASQLMRDFFFTCPSLDFAFNYARQSGGPSANIRVYEHNATKYTPWYNVMGVPFWGKAHLSDIPYILNGDIAGGDNSPAQQGLSRELSSSMVRFATSDSPVGASGLKQWPLAFDHISKRDFDADSMTSLRLALFGHPSGSGEATVHKKMRRSESVLEQAVLDERIFERCQFINSQRFRDECDV